MLPQMLQIPYAWPVQQQQETAPQQVVAALRFLSDLTNKTQPFAVPHGVGVERIEGQHLTVDEKETQKAACQCLKDYFRQKVRARRMKDADCPLCMTLSRLNPTCVYCGGSGHIKMVV